ncbi:MAG TPA: NAD(P)/FAD-dependent oxidoreductase [Conexibacter sp.]|jgi:cyclohexanone monooxygenase|nr:NAD(P)/FAD-dependent oxidoreductase [Conexibacter sp.]
MSGADEPGRAGENGNATVHDVHVAIIGGGLSGVGAAIMLRRAGIGDVVVLERADEVGGTWRDNTYPGCACDVPSALYSFSFAPNPDWGRLYAGQPEIREYARRIARKHGADEHVVTGADVLDARWDDGAQRWRIETTRGSWSARAVISATGPWSEPVLPDVPGLDTFEGTIFHSSRWNHDHALDGERVAVIGTGASAVQFVPKIQPEVEQLTVFQRTAQWVLPKLDRRVTAAEQALYRRVPLTQRALREAMYYTFELAGFAERNPRAMGGFQRIARRHLERSVTDPTLRAALTPDHTLGCKRILFSNEWYRALTQPNVELVPHAVTEVRAGGLVGADGVERPVDTLILGTGFGITEMPIAGRVTGRDGRTLDETWDGSPTGHLGTVVSGFPNFFMILGPNVGNGHTSATVLIEMQVEFAIGALKRMERDGIASADVRPAVQDAFNEEVQRRLRGTVWNAGGCRSYYLDRNGRNSTIYPGSTLELRRRMQFEPTDYALVPASAAAPLAVA